MGFFGSFVKGFVIMTVAVWIVGILEFLYIQQIALALLLLIGLMIALSLISYGYRRNRKEDRA